MLQEGHPVTKQVILLQKIRGKHAHSALEVEHEVRLSTSPQYHTKCSWRIDVDIHVNPRARILLSPLVHIMRIYYTPRVNMASSVDSIRRMNIGSLA